MDKIIFFRHFPYNLLFFPVVVLGRESAMSKDVDWVTQRSASVGAHLSNIEEELAESSLVFFLMRA
jgi:hypothetical protein